MHSWAVAISQPCSERRAIEHAERQGFECYFPQMLVRAVRKHKKVFLTQPLFPRYFFVRVNDQWRRLLGTVGVHDVIRRGENVAPVSDAIINGIKQRCNHRGLFVVPVPEKFSPKQKVLIHNGPFSGLVGIYDGMCANDRVAVLITMLGAVRHVALQEGDLTAVV